MEEEYKNILSEVSFIFKHIEKDIYDRIPSEVIEAIENNKNKNYMVNYDFNKKLKEQKFNKETFALISVIFLKYCVDDDKKTALLNICQRNDAIEEELLRQEFNPEKIFENRKKAVKENEIKVNPIDNKNKELITSKKENIISKVIKFIKNLFN